MKRKKIACVIGNSARIGEISAPQSSAMDLHRGAAVDASDFAKLLNLFGFDVLLRTDADESAFREILRDFYAEPADERLIFFEGDAVQLDGRNFLLPFDMTERSLRSTSDVLLALEPFEVEEIKASMREGCQISALLLDAARPNAVALKFGAIGSGRSIGIGLAPVYADLDTFIACSSRHNTPSVSHEGWSPFFNALFNTMAERLLSHIQAPLDITDLMRSARDEVLAFTNNSQAPSESTMLRKPFRLEPSLALDSAVAMKDTGWLMQRFLERRKIFDHDPK